MRPVPPVVLTLIHQFEGRDGAFEPVRAQDPEGNWEIGWSHKLNGQTDPLWYATLDQEAADELCMKDLQGAAVSVCIQLGVSVNTLTDNQYAALIDFTYNEGAGNFVASTLCRMIRAGDLTDAANQFERWDLASGQVLRGLVRRRDAEKALWLS